MLSVDSALSYSKDAIGIGRKGTIDKPFLLKAPFWTVDTLFYAIPAVRTNIYFMFMLFQKIDWRSLDESTGVPSLSQKAINSVQVFVPSQEEQRQIGSFFERLDSLIALHQRKLSKLRQFKKVMFEKMFPRDGESVPEIRFPGFTDAWEQRQAKALFKDYAQTGFPELPVLSATQDRGMIFRDDSGISIFHDTANEVTYKKVTPGQFVIHLRSFQGGFAHSAITGITSPAYTVFGFAHPDKHSDLFWKRIFSSEYFIKDLETVTYGIRDGRSISYNDFLGMLLTYPSVKEQHLIGSFFERLDSLIALHQRKGEKHSFLQPKLFETFG